MLFNPKIKILENADALKQPAETKIVLCYGHFNILHPGHFRYLEYAESLGDWCCVFLMDEERIPISFRENYFSEEDRAKALAALQVVDEIIIPKGENLCAAVKLIKPAFLLMGREHEDANDIEVVEAIEALEKQGGQVRFHAGDTHFFSSLLRRDNSDAADQSRRATFLETCKRNNITEKNMLDAVGRFPKNNVLVIGDTIVDQFVACDALGMSAEAPVVVVRELEAERFIGGAAIVAAHVQALGGRCHYISVVGDDDNADWIEAELERQGIAHYLFRDNSRPTTFKIRYLVEQQKMLRVSRLKEHKISSSIEEKIFNKIEQIGKQIDAIIISDFVYGLISSNVIEFVRDFAKDNRIVLFGDIQCSSQVGSVLKFKNFNAVFPTEREARIGVGSEDGGLEWVATQIMEQTGSETLLLKLGAEGFITYDNGQNGFVKREHFPALVSNPIDVTGAGDSLLASFALSLIGGSDAMLSSAIAANVAAVSVSQVGNQPIDKITLISKIEKLWM